MTGELGMLARWQEEMDAGRLPYQRCAACHSSIYYPRVVCPACGAARPEWAVSRGFGTIYAMTRQIEADGSPRTLALVDVAEGFRVLVQVTGEAEIGDPVQLVATKSGDGGIVPVFGRYDPMSSLATVSD